MANAKEIQNRIKSIKDTMKITNAMYMMSSMKLRKAKKKLEDTEPYFFGLQHEITDILLHFPDMQHIYFGNKDQAEREKNGKKGYIVITGDKGLAGAYNHNVIKEAQIHADKDEGYKLYIVGEVGRHTFHGDKYDVDPEFTYSANNPSMHRARMISEYIIDLYNKGELSEIDIIFTKLNNSISEEVEVRQLLPLKPHNFIKQELIDKVNAADREFDQEAIDKADDWYLIYPSPKKVLEKLVHNYITGFIYGALVEGFASEENARMLAMQSATENADAMLKELSVEYNRVRQAAITQEITEVIGGAKALKKKKEKAAKAAKARIQ